MGKTITLEKVFIIDNDTDYILLIDDSIKQDNNSVRAGITAQFDKYNNPETLKISTR